MLFFFASDLHGRKNRYESLWAAIRHDRPVAVFLGGDLLPPVGAEELIADLARNIEALQSDLGDASPSFFLILGNDDPRSYEEEFLRHEAAGRWSYLNGRSATAAKYRVYGYSYVPPTPFTLKDWERYDVSHYVDPGSISPEEGVRTVEISLGEVRYTTIQEDLDRLAGPDEVSEAIFLFHTPPYRTSLDRAALDGRIVDLVPLDVNVGSIAVRRFIEKRQPLVTLHGHVHESARLTGKWMDFIGRTVMLGAAHDGPELALIRFDPEQPQTATRELL
jgi:uncharacterized protein